MPLQKFECGVCGAKAPRKYLAHEQFAARMKWLRHHYIKHHPVAAKKAGWLKGGKR